MLQDIILTVLFIITVAHDVFAAFVNMVSQRFFKKPSTSVNHFRYLHG